MLISCLWTFRWVVKLTVDCLRDSLLWLRLLNRGSSSVAESGERESRLVFLDHAEGSSLAPSSGERKGLQLKQNEFPLVQWWKQDQHIATQHIKRRESWHGFSARNVLEWLHCYIWSSKKSKLILWKDVWHLEEFTQFTSQSSQQFVTKWNGLGATDRLKSWIRTK